MQVDASHLSVESGMDYDPEAEVRALLAQTARQISVAQVLVSSQRSIDVVGLQDQVGFLCAKVLDLPPSQIGFIKLGLAQLVSALDGLSSSLRANAA